MANIRADQTHKLTTMLTENYSTVTIEDLNIKGMMQNHKLAGSIADMSFFEFRRQLMYKAKAKGAKVIVADRWFASSKTCHNCGYERENLDLSIREWTCDKRGALLDRDTNAALNLDSYAKDESA